MSAASNYDTQFKPKERSAATLTHRGIYSHDIYDIEDDEGNFDINADLDMIQAFVTNQHSPGSHMPFGRWQNVSQSSKDIWHTIPDEDKVMILSNGPGKTPVPERGDRHFVRPGLKANFHAIDPEILMAYLHEYGYTDDTTDTADTSLSTDGNNTDASSQGQMVLVNTKQQPRKWIKPRGANLSPADPRKVLSSTSRSDTDSKGGDDIVFQGKTYHLANTAVTYIISSALRRNSHASLVDRGANGGIAGEDVRIIETTLRSINIQGIDNHQVANIPIAERR
jgi:hypothetical protein